MDKVTITLISTPCRTNAVTRQKPEYSGVAQTNRPGAYGASDQWNTRKKANLHAALDASMAFTRTSVNAGSTHFLLQNMFEAMCAKQNGCPKTQRGNFAFHRRGLTITTYGSHLTHRISGRRAISSNGIVSPLSMIYWENPIAKKIRS